jgi:hypothetical protein
MIRKSRPWRGGLHNPWTPDRDQSNRQPAAQRPETLDQARRWDVQRARAAAAGLCDRCASQYASGLALGFSLSHPPCIECAEILAVSSGDTRPNGWRNLRLTTVAPRDIRESPHAHRSRNTTPAKYVHGYGQCGGCGASWTGYTTCHCAGCHHTFADDRTFATHRVRGGCHDPQARGLVKITRAHWVGWGWPAQRDRG